MKNFIANIIEIIKIKRAKNLYFKYERYFTPLALLFGFIVDSLTLRRIDLWAENLVIIIYLGLALFSILFLSAYEAGRLGYQFLNKIAKFIPFVMQFVFGGLFSAFFVFYNRSASLSASWPFLLVIVLLLIGNEMFRARYQRLAFRLSIYFVALFSYSVFALPVFLGRIGMDVFLLSGLVALALICICVFISYFIAAKELKRARSALILSIIGIYLAFNTLYFFNLIPPIPLAVKESGIYHSLERAGSGYLVKYEPASWYMFWQDFNPEFHWQTGTPVYSYSAVFAPTKFSVKIFHLWSYYNEGSGEWEESGRLSFPIVGGRDGGYRGYSFKHNVWPGDWRVDVITEQGQIMSRTKFRVIQVEEIPELGTGER